MRKLYITLIVIMFGLTNINAQLSIYPSGDMTTNDGSSSMFPSSDQLWIANWSAMQNFHQILIKFDLSEYTGGQAISGKLNMYQFFHAPDGSPTPSKVYAITEEWDENSWPSTTCIAHGDIEYATPEFTSELGWYEIDITNLLNDWLSGSVTNYGLVIIADSQTKFAEFYSNDATNTETRPFLSVDGFVSVLEKGIIANDLNVFPNPVIDKFTVRFKMAEKASVEVNVTDVTGRPVYCSGKTIADIGENTHVVQVSELKKGIYLVTVSCDKFFKSSKIMVN